jgi:BMFP domain-containing protein YqiC
MAIRTILAQAAIESALSRCGFFPLLEVSTMFTANSLDDMARRLAESVPESLRSFGRDLEGNFKAVLQAQLSKLDLVSRQEFDVQAALLARTQASLADLEARIKELEAKLTP